MSRWHLSKWKGWLVKSLFSWESSATLSWNKVQSNITGKERKVLVSNTIMSITCNPLSSPEEGNRNLKITANHNRQNTSKQSQTPNVGSVHKMVVLCKKKSVILYMPVEVLVVPSVWNSMQTAYKLASALIRDQLEGSVQAHINYSLGSSLYWEPQAETLFDVLETATEPPVLHGHQLCLWPPFFCVNHAMWYNSATRAGVGSYKLKICCHHHNESPYIRTDCNSLVEAEVSSTMYSSSVTLLGFAPQILDCYCKNKAFH